ncbi:MAG: hypothetical protein ACI4AW_06000, partial [Paludibacteraceae bacterium]
VSEKISSTTDAKTLPQQKQRMKWANVVRMYKVLRDYMKLAFGGSGSQTGGSGSQTSSGGSEDGGFE